MKLSKFFRRYSRVLLMVFMSLLLVVFLLGDVLQNWATSAKNPKQKIGRAFDRDIYTTDINNASAKRFVLARVSFLQYVGYLDPLDFYLLTEEARRMGISVGREQVKRALVESLGGPEAADRELESLQRLTRRSYNSIYDIIGEWLAVEELVRSQTETLGESLPRAELAYRNQQQQATVKLSVLDSKAFLPAVPEPTEEELQKFFEANKDRKPNLTEDSLQFGYLLPDRVRLEYLTIDPQQNLDKVRVSEKEARAFYDAHDKMYLKSVPPPTSQSGRPTQTRMTFEEAQRMVKEDCRLDKAVREAQRVMNEIAHAAAAPWLLQPRQDGFREPPAPEELPAFEALRDKYAAQFKTDYVKTNLLSRERIANVLDPRPEWQKRQGSREPTYAEGQTSATLSELAMRVKGLLTPTADETLPVLNLLEPSPVLIAKGTSRTGAPDITPSQAYLFRVIEVAPQAPPAALEDVRAQVVADCKLLKAHELAGQQVQALLERARPDGLSAALDQATELKERLAKAETDWQPPTTQPGELPPPAPRYVSELGPSTPSLTREPKSVPGVGTTTKLPKAVFTLAESQPAEPTPGYYVTLVEQANAFKWVLVELDGLKPLYESRFAEQRASLLGQDDYTQMRAHSTFLGEWVNPDNVYRRTGFQAVAGALTRYDE